MSGCLFLTLSFNKNFIVFLTVVKCFLLYVYQLFVNFYNLK